MHACVCVRVCVHVCVHACAHAHASFCLTGHKKISSLSPSLPLYSSFVYLSQQTAPGPPRAPPRPPPPPPPPWSLSLLVLLFLCPSPSLPLTFSLFTFPLFLLPSFPHKSSPPPTSFLCLFNGYILFSQCLAQIVNLLMFVSLPASLSLPLPVSLSSPPPPLHLIWRWPCVVDRTLKSSY